MPAAPLRAALIRAAALALVLLLAPLACSRDDTGAGAGDASPADAALDSGGDGVAADAAGDPAADARADGAADGAADALPADEADGSAGDDVAQGPVEPPVAVCDPPIALIDTSTPDHRVGDGTPASCTEAALAAAVAQGGTIAFDCGDEPVTIDITQALALRTDVDTVIDGGGRVTLDGGRGQGRQTRLFELSSPNYRATTTTVTLERLTLQNAQAPATDFTPQNPDNPECSWGYKDGEGGAIRVRDARLHLIDTVLRGNRAASPGPDTGGGALFAVGSLEVMAVGCSFIDNQGANGGAVELLQSDGIFVNTRFEDNRATGQGENYGGASGCPVFNGPEQGGAGGNAGAVGIDGDSVDRVEFCGVVFRHNDANELATVGRTPNTHRGTSTFDRCLFDGNHAGAGGGAIWMQDMALVLTHSTVTGNTADGLGGGVRIDQGPFGSTIDIENTTFQGNVVNQSLGGALVFAGDGLVRNCTFAENEAAGGEGYFGGAIVAHGDGAAGLQVDNTIFWNNLDEHEWTPMTCSIGNPGSPTTLPGTGNVQWPTTRNGPHDVPDNPCTPDITWADADLGPLQDNGGPTPTMMPPPGSVALGLGSDCPATDQRGRPRPSDGCAAGAVEPP